MNKTRNLVGLHVFLQVCPAEPSVPVVSDVSTIHDLPKQVPQVLPWHLDHHNYFENPFKYDHHHALAANKTHAPTLHLCIGLQVVVEDVN